MEKRGQELEGHPSKLATQTIYQDTHTKQHHDQASDGATTVWAAWYGFDLRRTGGTAA
jgi:hypothetical protein